MFKHDIDILCEFVFYQGPESWGQSFCHVYGAMIWAWVNVWYWSPMYYGMTFIGTDGGVGMFHVSCLLQSMGLPLIYTMKQIKEG